MQLFPLHITPVSLIIFIVSFLSAVTLYLTYKTRANNTFSKLLVWAVLYILIHSLYIFVVEVWFKQDPWKDRLAPFGLLYGPLLYFAIIAVKHRRLSRWTIILHSFPFLFYGLVFIFLLTGIIPTTDQNQEMLKDHLLILSPISYGGYTIWSVHAGRSLFLSKLKGKVLLFVLCRILLLFVTMLSLAILFSDKLEGNDQAVLFIRMTMYICMLLCILVIFNYTVNRLLTRARLEEPEELHQETDPQRLPKYERSALSVSHLADYEQRLRDLIEQELLFLDKNLSLTSLAQYLKIPNHHLTQVFNVQIQQTFYQYINHLRIEHACRLLTDQKREITIEQLAEDSGFNSKVSFNRHFKAAKSCTPSDYKALRPDS